MIMRFSPQYLTYIKSSAWRTRRQRALARAGYRCQVCSKSARLQVHHNTYENLGRERDADLTVLCWECHMLYTWYSRAKRFFAWIGKGLKWLFRKHL